MPIRWDDFANHLLITLVALEAWSLIRLNSLQVRVVVELHLGVVRVGVVRVTELAWHQSVVGLRVLQQAATRCHLPQDLRRIVTQLSPRNSRLRNLTWNMAGRHLQRAMAASQIPWKSLRRMVVSALVLTVASHLLTIVRSAFHGVAAPARRSTKSQTYGIENTI